MNAAERLGLEQRVCLHKRRLGRKAAMGLAGRLRVDGDPISAYRCPFATGDDAHWHIGHGPSLLTLERVAEVLRDRRMNRAAQI
jgi:hypothetical protein